MDFKRFLTQAMLAVFTITLLGCGSDQPVAEPVIEVTADLPPADGVRMIPVENGRFKVWTRRVGNGDIKVLLLHGGPGGSHDYLVNFADHLVPSGYELYFYDQLGSFRSDKPDDVSLWTVERFLEEVETVRQALGLEDFVLIGQSWGGMLGIEYALKYQEHLKGLVISNMVGSVPLYVEGVNQLRGLMPAEAREILERHEAAKEYANPEYQEILFGQLYSKHLCRLDPWPQAVVDTFDRLNTTIYNHMQGPSEFEVTGTFKDWDRMDDLDKITVPTLLIVGRYDTMRVSDIEEMDRRMPDSSLLICENGSHISNWDDEDAYFTGVLDFLNDLKTATR
ncbi:MAG: proline iminopeptidase-family hydrolase [Acidobacteria bacterium]|nr:proline iminopeptidase-family hydrolase [Acidobacteriota bacterium]